jgi:hypothetical protein
LAPRICFSRRAHPPLFFGLAKKLVFNRTRKSLGLNNCQQFFNLGLGLPKATLDFFLSLNIPICELYGLSECTGVHTVSSNRSFRLLRWVPQRDGQTGVPELRPGLSSPARESVSPYCFGVPGISGETLLYSSACV